MAKESPSKYTPNPFGPCGPAGPCGPTDPDTGKFDPLDPDGPIASKPILAVSTFRVANDEVFAELALITLVAKLILPRGYDSIALDLN